MKRIAAVVRPEKLEPLKEALFQAKISGAGAAISVTPAPV